MPGKTGNTNADKRRKANKDAMREKIGVTKRVKRLDEICNLLHSEDANVPALKAEADIQFKLLGKVLPDLRAVELSGEVQHDHQHAARQQEDRPQGGEADRDHHGRSPGCGRPAGPHR